jgi:hypothetical protein
MIDAERITRNPLCWPIGWPRTQARANARFHTRTTHHDPRPDGTSYVWSRKTDLTIANAIARLIGALLKMGVRDDDLIVSSNLALRLDGLPRSTQPAPSDPGVAVYWQKRGEPMRCMAIDQYRDVADNIAAIAATLDHMRGIERHGGAAILDRAFTGFAALPAPGATREWSEVLGLRKGDSFDAARAAYRRLASENHPDKGGSARRMAEINAAWEQAQAALK